MADQQRVAAVNDLSGFGRCSLAVALPILSAMGAQVCPVPTMVLSAHTGYPDPYIRDCTEDLAPILAHWERLGLTFDAVYTGFLGRAEQADALAPFLEKAAADGALCVVDPAMADDGKLYATCTPALADAMRRLAGHATVTTPNLTEACLMTGTAYADFVCELGKEHEAAMRRLCDAVMKTGCGSAVITGVPGVADTLENWIVTQRETRCVSTSRVGSRYAGTGDVFSAVLCGYLLRGDDLYRAVKKTAAFVARVTAASAAQNAPQEDGIRFEPYLTELIEEGMNG